MPAQPHSCDLTPASGFATIEEHFSTVQALYPGTNPAETVAVAEAAGRVLAEDVVATVAVPSFSNSAMDGFALRASDARALLASGSGASSSGPWRVPVSGDVAAGSEPELPPEGHAQRIMTGAPVPEEEPVVIIPVEDTDIPAGPHPLPSHIEISSLNPEQDHVRAAGSNIQPGQKLAHAGTLVDAGTLAALLATGVERVAVHPVVRVGIVTTGDEVAGGDAGSDAEREGTADGVGSGAGEKQPSGSHIPDSNGPMLAELAGAGRVDVLPSVHRVPDDAEQLRALLDQLAETEDLIITTGGISAGAFDVVKEVAASDDVHFGPVNMQPGKPQGAGLWKNTPLVCLPGNPVSVWVSFHVFVSPLLDSLRGLSGVVAAPFQRPRVSAQVKGAFPDSGGRNLIMPVRVDFSGPEATVDALSGQRFGSHFVASLVGLNGIVVIPPETKGPAAGEKVDVLLL